MNRTNASQLSRRVLARGVAWSAPTIVVGFAAPAFAASTPCPPRTLTWTSGLASGLTAQSGATATVGSTSITAKLSGATGAANNATVTSMGTVSNSLVLYSPTGVATTEQTLSLTFSQSVSNVRLTISDLDSRVLTSGERYRDLVSVSPTGYSGTTASNGTTGAGTKQSPYAGGNSVEDNAADGNITLTWGASLTTLSLTYGQSGTIPTSFTPHIGISGITFTPSTC